MRIACPACNATYQVPDDKLVAGRIVRCARCGTDWAPLEVISASGGDPEPEAAESQAAVSPDPEPTPEPAPEPAIELRKQAIEEDIPLPRPPVLPVAPPADRGSMVLAFAWIVSLAVVTAAVAGLYAGRERVMKTWPPSTRAYAAIGLAGHPAQSEALGSERRE